MSSLQLREIRVDERHRRGAFADRAANALYRSRPHVTDREYARHARFEGGGRRPFSSLSGRSRKDESVCVERDPAAAEPFGFRIGADEHKQVAHVARRLGAGRLSRHEIAASLPAASP